MIALLINRNGEGIGMNISYVMFEKVRTEDGEGTIVGFFTPFNGIYYEPEKAMVLVWYGTDNAQNGWVSRGYPIEKIERI